jgi:hypothetical protein
MNLRNIVSYGALAGMVLMLVFEVTSISTDLGFINWYYFHGGKASCALEVQNEMLRCHLPENLSMMAPGANVTPVATFDYDYDALLKQRALMRYNETKRGGEG